MLNNPLGTYAENDKSTTDDLHCIRYSLLMPTLWQPPILSFSGYGTIALEKNGTHLLHP